MKHVRILVSGLLLLSLVGAAQAQDSPGLSIDIDVEISSSQLYILVLLYIALLVLPFWQIFKKAGFSPWLSLLTLIPPVQFVMLFFLAFSTWPALDERSA